MIHFTINGQAKALDVEDDTPLLWVIREQLGLTGTKFGCGVGVCGACTVLLNGKPVRTCILPVVVASGAEITTIEGLDHPVQEAWLEEQVPQCGYCQSGQLMAASALLDEIRQPTDGDIDERMTNLCRCATYDRIRKGIHNASAKMPEPPPEPVEETSPEDAPADGGE
ncbi:MAG TPA: (2Fe-2S)-binding protein [Myxococcota bacterium]|jgi:isoquinoline 1-oxidoreductase alpha subunit|nr:(2Fe-2S)-binding protein [Myxococcota bacterium]